MFNKGENKMKRLIVLLIVLFSVTAEAGYIRFFAVAPEIFQDTEENDYTGYQLGSKIVKQTRVEVLGSHAGQDLIIDTLEEIRRGKGAPT